MRALSLVVVSVVLTVVVALGAQLLLRDIDRGIPVALIFEEEGSGASLGRGLQQTLLRIIDDAREQKIARYHPLVFSSVNLDEAVRQAVEAGAVAILGGGTSTFTGRLLLAAEKEHISCVSPTANSRRLALSGDRLFRVLASTGARRAGRFAREQGFHDFVVLADGNNYQYVDSFLPDFVGVLGEAPLDVIRLERGLERAQIVHLLDHHPRMRGALLLLPDFFSALAVQLLRDFWPGLQIYVSDWGVSSRTSALAGSPGDGVWGLSFFAPETEPHLEALSDRLKALYGERPPFELLGPAHAALAMVDQAVSVGGPLRGGVAAALSAMRRVDRWGWDFPVDEAGDGAQPLYLLELRQGRWRTFEIVAPLAFQEAPPGPSFPLDE